MWSGEAMMDFIRTLRQIMGIAYIDGIWVRRQPMWLVQGIMGSIGFIMVMFAWGRAEALRNLAIAYVVVGAWSQGLNIVAQNIGWGRIGHGYERLVASPVTLLIYFLGVVVGTSPFMMIDVGPAIILSILVGMDMFSFMALLLLAPLALALGAFLSLSVILRIKNPTNISAITNPLNTITCILPPVYYPISILPPVLREMALAVPTVSLTEVGRWIVGSNPTYSIIYPSAIVAGWVIALTFLVSRKLRWGLE